MVDAERVKMNEELEKYRKLSDRKMRDLMQQAINEGLVVIWPFDRSDFLPINVHSIYGQFV